MGEEKTLTPIKAIRAKCLDCCCNSSIEVKKCTAVQCALYPYREGHNPNIAKRELTEEQRKAYSERAKALRAKQIAKKQMR